MSPVATTARLEARISFDLHATLPGFHGGWKS